MQFLGCKGTAKFSTDKKPRTMVFCTVLRSRVADLKYAIATVDPEAFLVIGVVQQVVGGYGQRIPAPDINSGRFRPDTTGPVKDDTTR